MVKKRKEVSSELHNAASLQAAVKRIALLLAVPERIAADMQQIEPKVDTLVIGSQPSLLCAMGDLARWGRACEDAWTAKMNERGDFSAKLQKSRKKHP